jgi:predicted nuclease of restriction endonuclease-like RecB superfamily
MQRIKTKHLLYIYITGLILTIFFKYKSVSLSDYRFVTYTFGLMLKNISLIGFMYKLFTNKNTQRAWVDLLRS